MFLALALFGCHGDGGPVVVLWTLDTLGLVASRESGYCEDIRAIAGRHGLDASCLDGAVPPAPWTLESHARLLYPQDQVGEMRSKYVPACGSPSMMRTIADGIGGKVVFAGDNTVFQMTMYGTCDDAAPWLDGVDKGFIYDEAHTLGEGMQIPEADRPVHAGIDAILDLAGRDWPVAGFLNSFEVGGHEPRCWFDPSTEACERLWQIAIDDGIIDGTEDPSTQWLDTDFTEAVEYAAPSYLTEDELHATYWATSQEAIAEHRPVYFDDRLDRLLDGLEAAGRLDDLELVISGDHGDNPCVKDPFGRGYNCAHGHLPTEWTGFVPVFTVPAAVGDQLVSNGYAGDGGEPWSLVNVDYALAKAHGVDIPASWPAMEPPGAATTWSCSISFGPNGVRVDGTSSLRCDGDQCAAYTWEIPDGLSYVPEKLDVIPDPLAPWADPDGTGQNWFAEACD